MIGIIVAGHGNFPTGIMSAVSLIAGNPEHIKAVDFVKGMSSQELKQKLEEQMEALGTSEILVMTICWEEPRLMWHPASKQRVEKVSKCWQERTWLWQWKQSFPES